MKRDALIGSLVGGAIPLLVWVGYMFFGYMAGPETVMLWPSSIVLLGLEGSPSLSFSVAIWFASAFVNVALYATIGLSAGALYRFATRMRKNV